MVGGITLVNTAGKKITTKKPNPNYLPFLSSKVQKHKNSLHAIK